MKSRREFIQKCCTFGAAGAVAHLTRFGLMTANAQSASGYKALVCVFLNGGNDGNNTVVPMATQAFTDYQRSRGGLALAAGALRPIAAAGNAPYGLHPRLVSMQNLYNQRKAAVIFNIGTLFRPTTKAEYRAGSQVPKNLFSHSDQTQQWQTSNPAGTGGTGWAGRVADLVQMLNTTTFPPGVSVNGGSLLLTGATTRPISVSPGSRFGLDSFGTATANNARMLAMQNILTFDTGVSLIGTASGVLGSAMKTAQDVNAALNGAPALQTTFPNSGIGQQLSQVAKIMQVRGALGMNRQIFFCGQGGYDNHSNLLADQDNLLGQLDAAINAFYNATVELGVEQSVTAFTESEFGRTTNASTSAGSDHGWGSHHFVVGGAVRGGTSYGTFPNLALGGPDDTASRGIWIPTTSLDQYAATMATWFGVQAMDLPTVVPNIGNFQIANLGFL